jgi:hypothetical protein
MSWDFWNRNKKKGRNAANATGSQPASQSAAASGAMGFPQLTSPKEILGLQQLIGNQEVLRMLDPGRVKRVPKD